MDAIRDGDTASRLDGIDLVVTVAQKGDPVEITVLPSAADEGFGVGKGGFGDDDGTSTISDWKGDDDGGGSSVVPETEGLTAHASSADDDLEFVAEDGEMIAWGEMGEKGVADGIEDGMVGDLERCGEREVGWEEEGLAVGVGIEVGGLVWSAGGDEDVECGGSVVEDVDGEVERMRDSALGCVSWRGLAVDEQQTLERKKRTSWLESQGTRPDTANCLAFLCSKRSMVYTTSSFLGAGVRATLST